MSVSIPRDNGIPENIRTQLNQTHDWLLRIHKALIDHEKIRYEKARGPIKDPGAFLNLLLSDPWFNWLRAASGLIVQIDEYLESKTPVQPSEGEALVAQAQLLLSPSENGNEFQKEYFRSIHESPDVGRIHADWKNTLRERPTMG